MTKILVVHDGPRDHALALTSIIDGLRKEYTKPHITWISSSENAVFYRSLPNVEVSSIDDCDEKKLQKYDVAINFGGSYEAVIKAHEINAQTYYGIYASEASPRQWDSFSANYGQAQKAYHVIYQGKETKQNIFQAFYQMANLSWRGQGYEIHYFPKSRAKDGKIGVAVKDDAVRAFVKSNLTMPSKLWHVPIKQDPMRQFDEVNCCESIITDNPFVMHVAVSLRKHVEFLLYEPPSCKLEFFGKGFCHLVPDNLRGPVSENE